MDLGVVFCDLEATFFEIHLQLETPKQRTGSDQELRLKSFENTPQVVSFVQAVARGARFKLFRSLFWSFSAAALKRLLVSQVRPQNGLQLFLDSIVAFQGQFLIALLVARLKKRPHFRWLKSARKCTQSNARTANTIYEKG